MKYSGHESFSIRKDWLAKGIRKIDSFKKDELTSMDELGIGKNMVKSLRYWLKVTGITTDDPKKKVFALSKLGELINKYDPYTEELGTLWLLQYNLANNYDNATSWFFFFNEFNLSEFTVEDYITAIKKWDEMHNTKPTSESSLIKDFDCLRRTYLQKNSYDDSTGKNEETGPESNMDCPFNELGLIKSVNKTVYKKATPTKQKIPLLIVLAIIIKQADEQKEIKLSDLQNENYSIGKVFNLDTILLISLLSDLENQGYVKVVRTAGLDILRINTDLSFYGCIEKYYKDMGNE